MTTPVKPNQCVGSEFDVSLPPTLRLKGPLRDRPWPFSCPQAQMNGLMVDRSSPSGVGLWVDPVNWAAFPTNGIDDGATQPLTSNGATVQASDFSFTLTNPSKFPMHFVLTTTFLARGTLMPDSAVSMKIWFTIGGLPTTSNWAAQPYRDSRYYPNKKYPSAGYHLTTTRTRTFGLRPNSSVTMRRLMYLWCTTPIGSLSSSNNLWSVVTTGYQYVPRPADFLGDGAVIP